MAKNKDILLFFGFFIVSLSFLLFLLLPDSTRLLWASYSGWVRASLLISSMVQFIFFGNIGDWIGKGLKTGKWSYTFEEFLAKAPLWAVIGLAIKYAFVFFDVGIDGLITVGLLPVAFHLDSFPGVFGILIFSGVAGLVKNGALPIIAFLGETWSTNLYLSFFMNATFGPLLMIGHRIGDDYLRMYDLKLSQLTKNIHRLPRDLSHSARNINWRTMKIPLYALPLFWLPAHTITFSLPSEYRVGVAAVLGIVLGVILGYSARIGQK